MRSINKALLLFALFTGSANCQQDNGNGNKYLRSNANSAFSEGANVNLANSNGKNANMFDLMSAGARPTNDAWAGSNTDNKNAFTENPNVIGQVSGSSVHNNLASTSTTIDARSASDNPTSWKKLKPTPAHPVSGEYIVELAPNYNPRDEATGLIRGLQQSSGSSSSNKGKPVQVAYYFNQVLNAFVVKNVPSGRIEALLNNPQIVNVWQNGEVNASAVQLNPASWGLDRIDANLTSPIKLDSQYIYNYTGQGVDVFVLDTPVYPDPIEFGSRFASCYSVTDENCTVPATGSHGTHVMGIVGSKNYGVAKLVTLHSVRVLKNDGSGTYAGVIAGLDYVVQQKIANPARKIVVNLSLGGGVSSALDSAVNNATLAGLVVVVSAGNAGVDACTWSPASATSAVTVGATDYRDNVVWYSNYGSCVDIYAPGASIVSIDQQGRQLVDSGTSMAAPHVAGAAALYLQAGKGINDLLADAATGALKALPVNSPNKLLYTGNITSSCYTTGATCYRQSQCCSKNCAYNTAKRAYFCQ